MLAYIEILERMLLLSVRNSHDILNSQRGSGRRMDFFFCSELKENKKIVPSLRHQDSHIIIFHKVHDCIHTHARTYILLYNLHYNSTNSFTSLSSLDEAMTRRLV